MTDLILTPTGLLWGPQRFAVRIGRGGVVRDKREGDGGTPAGILRIVEMLYRPDRLPRPAPWARPIGLTDLWCDAPEHPAYNRRVPAPFTASAEQLRRADPLYDLILVTDWNYPAATPHRGSAIFLHQRRGPGHPTAGCIAFARQDLLRLARSISPGQRVIVR